jgi:hypothetical protein
MNVNEVMITQHTPIMSFDIPQHPCLQLHCHPKDQETCILVRPGDVQSIQAQYPGTCPGVGKKLEILEGVLIFLQSLWQMSLT